MPSSFQLSQKLKALYFIVGTAIGAGILALPIGTANNGFLGGSLLLFICWLFMTLSAFYMLEARLLFAKDQKIDIGSMTLNIMGRPALITVEIAYLLLLFSLMAAYILVGSSWLEILFQIALPPNLEAAINSALTKILFTLIAAFVIFNGIFIVGNINQFISFAMLLTLALMLILGLSHIDFRLLFEMPPSNETCDRFTLFLQNIPLILTAFGFSIILPSLAPYLHYSSKKLAYAIILGSAIILIAYLLWEFMSFGILGLSGKTGLIALHQGQSNGTEIIIALQNKLHAPFLHIIAQAFVVFAVLSSLLGVGLALFHFMRDILPQNLQNKQLQSRLLALFLSFTPPLLLLLIYPAGIELVLNIAGIFVAFILGLLPTVIVGVNRITKKYSSHYKVWGGFPLIAINLCFFLGAIIIAFQGAKF